MRARRVLEQREEALNPAENGTAVNDQAALGEPLDDVGVAQAVAHIPANGRAITSSGKPWLVKALVERAVKRRPQAVHRHRCPPSRVCPSRRVVSLPPIRADHCTYPACLQQNRVPSA